MRNLTLCILIFTINYFFGCSVAEEDKSYPADAYVGSRACIECHQVEYDLWQGSHHDWAMRLAYDSTVLGDFNNVTFNADGEEYFFHRQDSGFYVSTIDGEGIGRDYRIAYTFGVTPLQQYLIQFPDGKYQTLRATWDTEKKIWFNQYAGSDIPASDWLHWQQGGQRWNTMCAECHSTNLEKNYHPADDAFSTTYSEINVSCESCHGPGGAHMNWAVIGDTLVDPQIQNAGYERIELLNQCAGCHARRVKLTEVMKPNVHFDDQFRLQSISTDYYYADGQIKDEVYVFGSFTQSKMFHKNVKCTDCHNSHSAELVYQGNLLCLQCHKITYESKDHHFHDMGTEGAQCVSCHMTGAVYMGNDFRRDHSFRVPRPDQSVAYGTPNACTGCHQDESDQWAADWIVKWYGRQRADHFSDHLLKASRPPYSDDTKAEVLNFINNMDYPAIARATALEYYPAAGDEAEVNMLLLALKDSAALVRYEALNKLQAYPPAQRLSIAMELLKDTVRMVRIGAANLMVEQDLDQIPVEQRGLAIRGREELTAMLNAAADFPTGRLQLGDYYIRRHELVRAIKEYEMALKMDYLLIPVYSNLATAYNLAGDNVKALKTLDMLIALEPGYGRGYYLRGLLNYEIGNVDVATNDLEKAIQFDPDNFRAFYNLANLYLASSNLTEAENVIIDGLKLEPDSQEGLNLLQVIRLRME